MTYPLCLLGFDLAVNYDALDWLAAFRSRLAVQLEKVFLFERSPPHHTLIEACAVVLPAYLTQIVSKPGFHGFLRLRQQD